MSTLSNASACAISGGSGRTAPRSLAVTNETTAMTPPASSVHVGSPGTVRGLLMNDGDNGVEEKLFALLLAPRQTIGFAFCCKRREGCARNPLGDPCGWWM